MLPEAVAYSGIAGLPPERAILAAIAGCLAYAATGRSRFAIVSPTSSSAAILAASIGTLPGTGAEKMLFVTVLIGLVACLFLVASLMRLGALAAFVSRPVLGGFAFGLAITIVVRQLPVLAGIPVDGRDIFHLLYAFFSAYSGWHLPSVAIGLAALAALSALRRIPALPGAFLVLVGGVAASYLLDLSSRGVAVVGPIDIALNWAFLQGIDRTQILRLVPFAFPLAFILLAESWGTIRSLALRNGDTIDANRELGALGAANFASALVQGMPVGAGFSAGVANEAAGATSRWSAVVAAIGVAVLIAIAGGYVAKLPHPVLAAVVISALFHALNPAPLLRLWRLRRDWLVALAAAASVLVLGVLDGLLVAVALSFAIFIRRVAFSGVAQLGRLGDSHDFVDIARHEDASEVPGIGIWRPTEALFFGNAESVLGRVSARALGSRDLKAVVVSLEESIDFDTTALDALLEFDERMRKAGLTVQYARMHDQVKDLLLAAACGDAVARSSFSVEDAVNAVLQQSKQAGG
ncbi:SulP family inorganic anion transporter [Rhizobium sp. KVB221]|uniref:SulP family inorganic anion transporter n=2 Tax=Rhizobium setariae TaxID=2801340 RepID=A0A936YQC4_9HYPH|nr:SulP family inorganic anion transporter [Rhizobium setariae]